MSPIWLATVALFAVSPLLASGSLGGSALQAMIPFAALLAVASVGQTLVMQQGGLDLSVPGGVALSAVVVAQYSDGQDSRLAVGVLLGLGVCVAGGLVVGLAVAVLRLTALVASLGVNALYVGAALALTGGSATAQAPPALSRLSLGSVAGVSYIALVCIAVVAVGVFVSGRTVVGRRLILMGTSPSAAVTAGIAVKRYLVGTFVVASCTYAVTGILLAGFLQTPGLNVGDTYLLSTLAAVVLGGTALTRGGAVLGAAGGALFLTQLQQVVLGTGAPPSSQYFVQGGIIAAAMLLQGYRTWGPRLASMLSVRRRPATDRMDMP
ncbi:hypothetical protein BJF78_07225 [Pseudonocardia sp. CNS-139]|nr:hypothetical protein BJF78_07225 [Pseudonocardia sp. CNS-139]